MQISPQETKNTSFAQLLGKMKACENVKRVLICWKTPHGHFMPIKLAHTISQQLYMNSNLVKCEVSVFYYHFEEVNMFSSSERSWVYSLKTKWSDNHQSVLVLIEIWLFWHSDNQLFDFFPAMQPYFLIESLLRTVLLIFG